MPKLDLADLLALTERPNIAEIELSVLQKLYDEHLYPYMFVFELTNEKEDKEVIKLNFDRDKFCHLIGLDNVPKALLSAKTRGWDSRRIGNYKGSKGWDNIINGTIDMAHIMNLARRVRNGLGESRRKLINFYYLPQLMKTGNFVIKYITRQFDTHVTSDLFIYDIHDNLYLQIGLKKEDTQPDIYYPETFIINSAGPNTPNPRAAGNTVHTITNRYVLTR